jgi:hypothetical protein
MEWLALGVLSGLATWRLASLLHTEDAFAWLRHWIGIGDDGEGYPTLYPGTFWGKVFDCFWCLSLVAGVVSTAFLILAVAVHWLFVVPIAWLAGSAVAIYWEKQIMRTQSR